MDKLGVFMQTKHVCILIHILTKGEVGTGLSPPVNIFTDCSKKYFSLLWIVCVKNVLCFSSIRVCSLLPCGNLLGKG